MKKKVKTLFLLGFIFIAGNMSFAALICQQHLISRVQDANLLYTSGDITITGYNYLLWSASEDYLACERQLGL